MNREDLHVLAQDGMGELYTRLCQALHNCKTKTPLDEQLIDMVVLSNICMLSAYYFAAKGDTSIMDEITTAMNKISATAKNKRTK